MSEHEVKRKTGARRGVTLGLTLLLGLIASVSWATERVALVIGNSAYADRPLANPVNDAADVAAALGKLGFEVISERNLDRRGLHRALQSFRERLRGKQLGLFFYAGHGAQYQNRNYLIPINADISDTADLPIEALEVDSVLAQMQNAGNEVSVVILDACRNLPYPGANRSSDRGLAPLNAIRGSLVAYATSPGKVAQDGVGRNSPYTAALLAEINKPVSLTELFNNVGWTVATATQNQQEPWYSTSPLPKIILAQWNDQSAAEASQKEREAVTEARGGGAETAASAAAAARATTAAVAEALLAAEAPLEYRRAGRVFRDRLAGGSDGPSMVVIPAGSFQMGSPEGETGRDSDERSHKVEVKNDFALGQYEVTVGEFRRFVEATKYQTEAERNAGGEDGCYAWSATDGKLDWRAGLHWRKPGYQQSDQHPVVCVSWNDAVAYTEWLSKQVYGYGVRYRLPTETEWEYAARAGTSTARYWGDDPREACQYANVADQTKGPPGHRWADRHACEDGHWYPALVGSFKANAWGLGDMLGNVWEWTCSKYTEGYDGSEQQCVTKDTVGPFALRGGSWGNKPAWVRSANRDWNTPSGRYDYLGFRLARSL